MSKLDRTADKVAGKTKRVVAEVIGDGRLSEEGRRQERQAERRAEEDDEADVSKIANNLT